MTTEIPPELAERMAALVREIARSDRHTSDWQNSWFKRAAVLAALLPKPVDPLLIEAREIADDFSGKAGIKRSRPYADGNDDDPVVDALVFALRRGIEIGGAR